MTCTVLIVAEAEEQVHAIDEWWTANRPSAPSAFFEEFKRAVDLLAAIPAAGPLFPKATRPGIRRFLLKRSQHWIYYVHDARHNVVYILSVWSTRRGEDPKLSPPRWES